MSQISFKENGTFPLPSEGQVGDVVTGIIHQGRRMIGVKYAEGWIYSFLDNDIKTVERTNKILTKKKRPQFAKAKSVEGGQSNAGENVGSGSGVFKGMDGSKLQFKTITTANDTMLNSTGMGQGSYAPIEVSSNTNDLGLSVSSTFVTAFNSRISQLADDSSPQLASILDVQDNAVTQNFHANVRETVASNVCTIDLTKGNFFFITIGETCTQFNIDFSNNSILNNGFFDVKILFEQNGSGGYQVSNWNLANDSSAHNVCWKAGSAPTLTTGDDKVDIITFTVTPSKLYGSVSNNY